MKWEQVRELPALVTKHATFEGLDAILLHLRTHHTDLDSRLPSNIARADAIAFTSHTHLHLPPLLALSLYVSSSNYTTTTRHAISSPLPFPLAYTIPPSLRAAAKTRSQHLGLSSLDLDAISSADDAPTNPARGIIPQHLLQGMRRGVTETIQQERAGLMFRLDGLVDEACAPLARLLGDKKYFLSNEEGGWSSLDAVALGYLALALMPEMPQPWLKDGIRGRYPNLTAFVERGVKDIFGGDVTLAMAREGGGILPWQSAKPSPLVTRVVGAVVGQIVEGIPLAASRIKIKPKEEGDVEGEAHSLATTLILPVAAGAAVVAAVVGGEWCMLGQGRGMRGGR
ncbi:MAG: hypothetical protein OHK93_002101 [Ramalina farinacea]|uniref:Uncharacterized protein n=1 Tax=Ramalina farinacea TaxID=258253 RepID=A0AA43QQP8_9LECA|nr:hypothetical protein [Ramalina farinacea]